MAALEPTAGAIARICERREQASEDFRPLLEVQDLRRMGNGPHDARLMVILSDGTHTVRGAFGMGPVYQQVTDGKINLHCLLRLTEWYLVEIPSKKPGRPPSEILTITTAEAAGNVPAERRIPLQNQPRWGAGAPAGDLTQMSQGEPPQQQFGMPQQQQQQQFPSHTTPERAGGPSYADRTPNHAVPQNMSHGGVPAAPMAPWQAQRQAPSAAWGAMTGGDSLAQAQTQDQPLFGGAPAPAAQPPAHNPYSAGVGLAAAPPGGQPFGFSTLPPANTEGGAAPHAAGGNLYGGATAPAAAPGGSAQGSVGAAPSPYGMPSNMGGTAPAGGNMPSPYGMPSNTSSAAPAASPYGMPSNTGSAAPAASPYGMPSNTGSAAPAASPYGMPSNTGSAAPASAPYGMPANTGGTAPAPSPYSMPGNTGGTAPAGGIAQSSAARYSPPLQAFGFQAQAAQQPPQQQRQMPPSFAGAAGLGTYSAGNTAGQLGPGRAPAAPGANIMPIAGLSPYTNGRWRIKARVTHKSDVRKFNNNKGEGQLFKIDLVDKDGSEISATFFGRAVDRFFEMLQTQQVYYFSRGSVKMANKRFDKGEFVITFDEQTSIEAAEQDQEIPGVNYNFVPLADVDGIEVNTTIDVKGVILEAREAFTVTLRKNNEERVKREIVLWDDSGPDGSAFLSMTIWGQHAHDNFEAGTVMYAKGMRVSEWNGAKSLNGSSGYELNPDSPQAFALQRKFEEKRPNQSMAPTNRGAASRMTGSRQKIEEIREEDKDLGPAMVPGQALDPNGPRSVLRHIVMATLTHIPADRPPYYPACPELVEKAQSGNQQAEAQMRTCNKKVTQNGNIWSCQAGHTCQKPLHRYLANRVQVVDPTGSLEISFFDEAGRQIFGCEANDIADIWQDPTRDGEVQQKLAQFSWKRYLFRLTSKKEMWQDEQRVRINCEEAAPLNFIKDGQRMLAEVKAALEKPPPEQDALGAGGL